ncbi:MAG TPA: ATP-binding protein [Candidatus Limnocylindria bacterium]
MRITAKRRRDALALLIATVTALAGVTSWLVREVDIGVRLGTTEEGFVQVVDVVPGSLAEYYGFGPGALVVDLQRRDGSSVPQRASHYRNDQGSLDQSGAYIRFASEVVDQREISSIYAVSLETYPDGGPFISWGATLSRDQLTSRLDGGGVALIAGILLGLLVTAAVSRGWAGADLAGEATVAGVAAAVPLMALPLTFVGAPVTSAAGVGLAALGVLPLGWSFGDSMSAADWSPRVRWLATGLALLAIVLPVRLLLGSGDGLRAGVLLAASVVIVPAVGAAMAGHRRTTERLQILALGTVSAGAVLAQLGPFPELAPLILALLAAGALRLLPRFVSLRLPFAPAEASAATVAPRIVDQDAEAATTRAQRDFAALLVAAMTFIGGLVPCCETGAVAFGALLGAAVGFALHRGLLGSAWARAAIPLGCAVAVPIMALAFNAGGGTQYLIRLLLPAAGALPVAHLLAWRHPDPAWRRPLFAVSTVLALVVALLAMGSSIGGPLGGPYDIVDSGSRLTIYLAMGFIALAPGLASAAATATEGTAADAGRLDLLAMGLTPGVAMTVLPGSSSNVWPLALWLVALVVWRRLSIAPLLGLAMRTQRQRDLAVAAVEAERARLAADIHDDALQELSALVRRLDASGDAEAAELARSVAERLRAITSDLRLPLLDDLGAGPALEWLVGRFQPLADGEVRLERADPHRPPAGVELAVFRVAQEAIANAVKHGKPPITVRYRVDDAGAVSLSVDDQGPGIEPDAADEALRAGHLGVANMQQRAEQIGALLDIRRWPGGGTHVALEWRPR